MQTLTSLKDRFADVKQRIARAAERSGRSERDVLLVVVSKYADPEQILELIQLGHVDFGESRVQQLAQRAAMVDEWPPPAQQGQKGHRDGAAHPFGGFTPPW
jgi:uncharacterized pyridoxal phosphate-containing UPF0001 family protein